MTDDDKALVERLRDQADRWYGSIGSMHSVEWEAAERIETQAAGIEEWRACARYDAMMEGPAFKGWDMSALDRCRRAALQEQSK